MFTYGNLLSLKVKPVVVGVGNQKSLKIEIGDQETEF